MPNITETISLLDEPNGSIGLKRHHLAMAIRSILQREIAGEVWYESRTNDNKLQDCLSNAERELTDYVLQISTPDESITALRQAALDGERYKEMAEQYQKFKLLLGIKSHDSIMRLTNENKDFPVTATMIMMEEDNERRRNAMRYIETSARAGKDLAKAIERSQENNRWCADCLAKVDCKEALETYRQAVEQKEV